MGEEPSHLGIGDIPDVEENLSAVHGQVVAVDKFCQKMRIKIIIFTDPRDSSLNPGLLLLGTSLSQPPWETVLSKARSGGSFCPATTTWSMVAFRATTTPACLHPSVQSSHTGATRTFCTPEKQLWNKEMGH